MLPAVTMECRACPSCGRELYTDQRAGKVAHAKPPCEVFLKTVATRSPRMRSDTDHAEIEAAAQRYRESRRGILDRPNVRRVFIFLLGMTAASLAVADWQTVLINGGACLSLLLIDRWMARKRPAATP